MHIWSAIESFVLLGFTGLLTWNAYLFKVILNHNEKLHKHKIDTIERFITKEDIEKLLQSVEINIEKVMTLKIDKLEKIMSIRNEVQNHKNKRTIDA